MTSTETSNLSLEKVAEVKKCLIYTKKKQEDHLK
jgi:hypothetical protein